LLSSPRLFKAGWHAFRYRHSRRCTICTWRTLAIDPKQHFSNDYFAVNESLRQVTWHTNRPVGFSRPTRVHDDRQAGLDPICQRFDPLSDLPT